MNTNTFSIMIDLLKETSQKNILKHTLSCLVVFFLVHSPTVAQSSTMNDKGALRFTSSKKELENAFNWAKDKALSYAHDNSDPVGYWYEAALPNREAFCMRDVSHQAIGAEILGLGAHNYNMLLKFAQNISSKRDYCSFWEINRYNKPAPEDYANDQDFWYNLPANFDVVYNAYRLYEWTGNRDYLENEALKNFYDLSMNQYVDHWGLGSNDVLDRNRSMHLAENLATTRFGNHRGIPTYNEGGRGSTLLGIDMTASLIAAYKAYTEILKQSGEKQKAKGLETKIAQEEAFMNEFWWDDQKKQYRSIWYEDDTFDYFMVGDNQAFLHYPIYFNAITDSEKVDQIVSGYYDNADRLIVELKSYLPIIFYEHNFPEKANQMIIDLCSEKNKRRDYPENSFTVIEHITRGLMGIEPDAAQNSFTTRSRLKQEIDWAEMKYVPILSNRISVRHEGKSRTIVTNESGATIYWKPKVSGSYEYLYLNGKRTNCTQEREGENPYSYVTIALHEGESITMKTP
ncbi:hypothetical protein [Pareuzebyella sediminis]|uniref:hypothetical protein n=1 Tax=Pareuzebyella sediminis TaxID=2607998 RepID=UPI0011EE75F9|nr:hypothetical protein [Pareuzebyella sediminis]